MEIGGGSNVCVVPPGFRFHPTDEELLYYYLRKKISYESIDLDVIREVDLNKLEPWDLKEKCRIGSGPQNEWYFFSHKDKKYPTGTRTNRATAAGFWKATGRDKAIHFNTKRIGMRKTLVFYTGRAPHGQKTDWIMHEYRLQLDDDHLIITNNPDVQEDGWVVCRVFKKKIHSNRSFEVPHEEILADHNYHHHHQEEEQVQQYNNMATVDDNQMKSSGGSAPSSMTLGQKQNLAALYDCCTVFDGSGTSSTMHHQYLPQLLSSGGGGSGGSPDHHHSACSTPTVPPNHVYQQLLSLNYDQALMNNNNNTTDIIECSQNLLRLTSDGAVLQQQHHDWSFLDKLLTSSSHGHHQLQHPGQPHKSNLIHPCSSSPSSPAAPAPHHHHHALDLSAHNQRFPFQYLGFETDLLKFPK